MIVRRPWLLAATLALALLCGAGCSDRDGGLASAETDDAYYVQGVQFKRQGRNPEALTSFLKVIDKRGERGAAESHFEAGQIYLNHIKEPAYAYYHFRKYLELQPNSPQAELVRGMVGAALREFAKTVPGRASEDQSVRLKATEEISKLQREVEELRAELAVLRGGGTTPINRPPPRMITAPTPATAAPQSSAVPLTRATEPPITAAPVRAAPAPVQQPLQTAPAVQASPMGSTRPNTTTRPAIPGGRTHTVRPKETLYAISKLYNVKVEDIVAANGIKNPSNVPIGTVLRIPTPAAAPAGR